MKNLFRRLKHKRTPLSPKTYKKNKKEFDLLRQAFFAMVILTAILGIKKIDLDITNTISGGIKQVLSYELKKEMIPNYEEIQEFIRGNMTIKVFKPSPPDEGDAVNLSLFPPTGGTITSVFGKRTNPITGAEEFHHGIDIMAEEGTPVYAAMDGIVEFTGFNPDYGNYIRIQHKNKVTTLYAHLSKISVSNNQWVNQGDIIGEVGNTGNSTGPHLHFELIINGNPTDPWPYFMRSGN